ncbi:MAG: RnfABCDGE type electron transport complex subunit B, partial [Acidiferrobacter sp.]
MIQDHAPATLPTVMALLPQTQCRRCGFDGCQPYARALLQGQAAINRCPPGGEYTRLALAQLLHRE